MGRNVYRTTFRLLMAAIAFCLGLSQGMAVAGQGGNGVLNKMPPANPLEALQDQVAAKRAAEGMMRGMTNRHRWAAAARHADIRAQVVRDKEARENVPPGQKGGGK